MHAANTVHIVQCCNYQGKLIHGGLAFDALDELEKMFDANDVANHGISGRELLSTFGKRSTRLFDVLIAVSLNHFSL